ncbi:hypothetical protein Sru01_35160 [Sphaerisporangium rufum]|uniref:protein-serine/threonine phosphatase n=1 Tax=Sphaerisporangium rufum TaxID=1381558 RepID=A0A919R2J4_9ACTN|nr:SpoIIE family protein phosphatase [Sphaerisporangium rufum]GII78534.1 hypothetical protein Sru01_35160 [Sphaerisporangium rufum]
MTRAAGRAPGRGMLLDEISTRIGAVLDPRQAAEHFMDVAVPRFADSAALYVLEGLLRDEAYPGARDGSVAARRLALRLGKGRADRPEWAAAFPAGEIVVYHPGHPAGRCMSSRAPVTYTAAELGRDQRERVAAVLDPVAQALIERSSFLAAPLVARGTVLGFISFGRDPDRTRFGGRDRALAADLAGRVAVCVDNARLFSREQRTARAFQRNLAPFSPSVPPGLEVAHRYLPVSAQPVGGDWYDVIPLSATRVALVIGDAMGHGPAAAGAMGQLRAAVRALAGFDLPPDEVLRRLDRLAEDMDAIQCATCLYATVDLDTRRCALSRAGHPPPILVRPGGPATLLEPPAGLALGVGDPGFARGFTTTEVTLPPGGILAFYTDGLVESREEDIDLGIAALRAVLATPRDTLEAACDAVIAALPVRYDDVALLLTRVAPPATS